MNTRLSAALAALPDNALVPVGWIREQLGAEPEHTPAGGRSYTLHEVAEHPECRRSVATVRAWIRGGDLKAFPHGREQRVTEAELLRFLEGRRAAGQTHRMAQDAERVDLGGWRAVRRQAA